MVLTSSFVPLLRRTYPGRRPKGKQPRTVVAIVPAVPARRILPDNATLKRWVELGMTHKEIAEEVARLTGETVSRSSVSAALHRAGLSKSTARYSDELPWRVHLEHMTAYPARMLRLLGRRRAGLSLTQYEDDRLDSWLETLKERGLVVAYSPDRGFLYVEADEVGDGARGIPIRRRTILRSELP